ncbi:hypothetical protein BGZ98_001734 [Dissophora globulifera]|nr:hypothetical protein BGZ98_001734 [Dissophora globulifera]
MIQGMHRGPLFDSPVDYRDVRHYRDEHDMEHCSEQDDVREREYEDEEEEEDEDEDEGMHARKIARHHLVMDIRDRPQPGLARVVKNDYMDDDTEEGNSTLASSAGSRKPSLTSSPQRDDNRSSKKLIKSKTTSSQRGSSRQASVQAVLEEVLADDDEDGHGQDGSGAQSLHGKGLGYYAPLVCECVEARNVTTYNDLVYDLAGERTEGTTAHEPSGQGNIRRRVYDALNILEALGIITMDKKEIRWIGIQDAKPIREVSRRVPSTSQSVTSPSLQQLDRDGADESEEPEDDEMEIEQLQKEIQALKLMTALEGARLKDQVARSVQLTNLVERNKRREEKELERQMRRRQRRHERKEEKKTQATVAVVGDDGESMDVDDESSKRTERRHHRHHRHRSPRPEKEGHDTGDLNEEGNKSGEDVDDEAARRARKQERRERRERKEKRAQRRLEKEAEAAACEDEERIQLPLFVVRVPGYAGQSSDSEASISVVRRVREEQRFKKSGKSKKHCVATGEETTMVEIKIPHQEELSIISDTEILGDLGLNEVPLNELREILPQDALENARYTTTTKPNADGTGETVIAVVRGGFERALVCSVGQQGHETAPGPAL